MHQRLLICTLVSAIALLSGCAGAGGSERSAPQVTPVPSPTVLCTQPDQTDCLSYDPDEAMALNDQYRERMRLTPNAQAAAEAYVTPVASSLEEMRQDGPPWSEHAVVDELVRAGLSDVQIRSAAGDVLFGAQAPAGGCVFGALEAERVSVEAGGYIMDGGCLPAQ